jgi:hypothetical protein
MAQCPEKCHKITLSLSPRSQVSSFRDLKWATDLTVSNIEHSKFKTSNSYHSSEFLLKVGLYSMETQQNTLLGSINIGAGRLLQ